MTIIVKLVAVIIILGIAIGVSAVKSGKLLYDEISEELKDRKW